LTAPSPPQIHTLSLHDALPIYNGNLGGQSSQQLSVSFDIDLSLSPGRLPRRTTDHLPARVQFNALHFLLTGKQSANDVSQICRATSRTKKHQPQIIALQ